MAIEKLDLIKLPSYVTFSRDYFVLSDIHGRFNKFKELMLAKPKDARTIILGDIVNRGYQNARLLKVLAKRNYVILKGNHDIALYYVLYPEKCTDFEESHFAESIVYNHGGQNTLTELQNEPDDLFLNVYRKMHNFYLDKSLLFVHSGVFHGNIQESLNCPDGMAMCLYDNAYLYHPVWAGEAYEYPSMTFKNYKLFIVHGHTPVKVTDIFQETNICCDIGMKAMLGLHFRRKNNTVRPYLCT